MPHQPACAILNQGFRTLETHGLNANGHVRAVTALRVSAICNQHSRSSRMCTEHSRGHFTKVRGPQRRSLAHVENTR